MQHTLTTLAALRVQVNIEEDWGSVLELVRRARNAPDMRAGKTHKYLEHSKNMKWGARFDLVHTGYYRQAAILNSKDAQAQVNYAIMLQFVYNDYETATEYYLRALLADPYDPKIMQNFNFMLYNLKQVGGGTPCRQCVGV